MNPVFIVISGPSGVGKTTIVNELLKLKFPKIKKLITCTTREKRPGEKDGIDYIFWDKHKFKSAIVNNELFEYEIICGNYYGSPKIAIMDSLNKGISIIASLGIMGAAEVKNSGLPSLLIFIKPPSIHELERRLTTRGTAKSELEERLLRSNIELEKSSEFDYTVTNDDLNSCVEIISGIINNYESRD